MDALRRNYIRNIRADISRLEKAQQRDKESVKILQSMKINQEIATNKKKELQDNMEKRQTEIETLNQRVKDIENGLLDNEICNNRLKNTETVERKHAIHVDRKRALATEKAETREKQNQIRRKHRKENRSLSERAYAGEYRRYCRNSASLPDYMKKKLKNMPHNKGYIWRGIWFCGYKRREHNQPTIMFEKLRGGVLRIHEINSRETKIYEKQGKNTKRILISRTPRNKEFQKNIENLYYADF